MPFLASILLDSAKFSEFREIVRWSPSKPIIALMIASNIKYYTATPTATFCGTVWCQKKFFDITETQFFSTSKVSFRRCTCFIELAHNLKAPSGRAWKGRSDAISYECATFSGRFLHTIFFMTEVEKADFLWKCSEIARISVTKTFYCTTSKRHSLEVANKLKGERILQKGTRNSALSDAASTQLFSDFEEVWAATGFTCKPPSCHEQHCLRVVAKGFGGDRYRGGKSASIRANIGKFSKLCVCSFEIQNCTPHWWCL